MELVAVTEAVLRELVQVAVEDADANDVTPPLSSGIGWTPERIAWLHAYHRDRRAGLDGPAAEATWAVAVDGSVVGSVRLKQASQSGVLETGIWLTRGCRGRGIGRAAMAATLAQARGRGATEVRAETTLANSVASALLRTLGFEVSSHGDCVRATCSLR